MTIPLILRELTSQDEAAFFQGMKEWDGEDPHWYSFCWQDGMKYTEMMEILRKDRLGLELPANRVPHTMLYAFLHADIIGRVSVRHTLNDELRYRGGHIGYGVAPRFRKKGYASEMVRQSLDYCRSLGLDQILITCGDTNTPSWKIIEKFGGELENLVWDNVDNEMIRRYWLKL